MQCVVCSLLSCLPGFFSSGCIRGASRDAACIPCTNGPVGGPFVWTRGCEFQCLPNYWLDGRQCRACSVLNCTSGTYLSECGAQDAACVPCEGPSFGPAVWTVGCNFTCDAGFAFDGAGCYPLVTPPPPVFYPSFMSQYGQDLVASVGAVSVGGAVIALVYSKAALPVVRPFLGPMFFVKR